MENAAPVGFRLSPLQKILWNHSLLRAGVTSASLRVEGPLDGARLERAFCTIAERHESLRTYFQTTRGFTLPFQLVRPQPAFAWHAVTTEAEHARLLAAPFPVPAAPQDESFQVLLWERSPSDHRLTVRVPALCCDRASLELVLAEVVAAYAGRPAAEESVQYADFSEWHNELLSTPGDETDEAAAFWAVPTPAQPLPLCGRDAAITGNATAVYPLPTIQHASESTLAGCWLALLWRLTGQDTTATGVEFDGRPLEDLRLSAGLFARPLPLAVVLDETTTFAQLFASLAERRAALEQIQAYAPAALEPGSVLFEATTLPADLEAGPVVFRFVTSGSTPWPAALALVSEGTELSFRYDPALYTPAAMARLAGYLERTVQAATQDPTAAVFAFDLVGPEERADLLAQAQGEQLAAGGRTFPQMFEAQAALTPDAPAIRHEAAVLSYAQANAQANRLAAHLRSQGVGPGVPVGLSLPRSVEMIVALLGIVKAGGAYLPLLPDLPPARLAHQIAETGLRVIVSMEALLPAFQGFEGNVLCLDRDHALLARQPQANAPQTAGPGDLMYILYTSGSTGTPKGVEVSHANVMQYVLGINHRLGLTALSNAPGLNFATVSTLGADLGNTCIFPPLVTGGSVTVVGYDAALDGALFARQAAAAPIDVLKLTPSNLRALLAGGTAGVLPRRWLITGGEALPWDLARQVLAAGTGCALLNHYGPTEASVGCLTQLVEPGGAEETASVPLGRPLANTQVYVLDSRQRLQPAGAAGELCVAGPGVTRGYLQRPQETAARFLANPFAPGLLYRTGDRARMLPGGAIDFLGRLDHQVKIRGYRVELAEVEAVLAQVAGVERAIVLLAEDAAGPFLTAYLVAPGVAFDAVQQHLRRHLPDYMLPREFVALEHVPLSSNGKVDRQALAAMSASRLQPETERMAPRTPLEHQLAGIWKESLKLPEIGIRDNFFELGGHSLLATQIVARIRSGIGLHVSIRMLFEAPTVESLAQAIESTQALEAAAAEQDSELDDLLAELEGLAAAEAQPSPQDLPSRAGR